MTYTFVLKKDGGSWKATCKSEDYADVTAEAATEEELVAALRAVRKRERKKERESRRRSRESHQIFRIIENDKHSLRLNAHTLCNTTNRIH